MRPTLHALVEAGDHVALAERLGERFGVTVCARHLKKTVPDLEAVPVYPSRTDDCIIMWLKARLNETGCFSHGLNPAPATEDWVTATMHVFFMFIEETEEQLALLRREVPLGGGSAKVAQSKIFQTAQLPHPIDRVAKRVAPET